ncbi:5-formyltetrahydrofolate cyclo-ligase [Sulfurovum lithotrophicum]|uniref:5-formyltetrahydrofolate cyclo-ligase n=1 Tax=Sulfurovum lithotrophicum TaxID=206403 RepID=A0A7U4RR27_9BACT|nr:5-formyltetrahydrofolate cyclo-ligase [Sulfurovum lithotrophicum]AKF25346.1 5-formyltetrahydrofolate cyclo-ligase [Sulfurovum lithotrophicum]
MEVIRKERRKKQFRQRCLERLKEISRKNNYVKDKKVLSKLYEIIEEMDARVIMLYLPLELEVNLYPLIKVLRRQRRQLYVPFMEGKSFSLVKYRYPLKTKRFGIKEPKYSRQFRKKKIDIAIVPIVGVDLTHRRVGFGKGMYDRFFEKEMKNIGTTVFVARQLCYSSQIVTDGHDVRADRIVVP